MRLWLDINNRMNRTGIEPNDIAIDLYKSILNDKYISIMGLHVYDGHIRPFDINERNKKCDLSFKSVIKFLWCSPLN